MNKNLILPNVIISGAPKCGTTSLFDYLADHPEVCASEVKEARYLIDKGYSFFNADRNVLTNGLVGYQAFFDKKKAANAKVILEATPDYLYQTTPLEVIPTFPSIPLIIFVLRKPSARIYSFFRFAQNNMAVIDSKMEFSEFIERCRQKQLPGYVLNNTINHSHYVDYLEKWYRVFGKERIKILFFEDLVTNPGSFMQSVCKEIQIDARFYRNYEFATKNKTYHYRSQFLQRLKRKFSDNLNNKLLNLLFKKIYSLINQRNVTHVVSEEDKKVLAQLDAEYESSNIKLAELTGVNIKLWDS